MDARTAQQTLDDVARARRGTRQELNWAWFPLVFFGSLTVLSAVVAAVFGPEALGVFWPVAGIGGFLVMGWYASRVERERGVAGPAWRHIVLAVALIATALTLGFVGTGVVREAGPPMAVAVAYLGWAVMERSAAIAMTAGALVLATLVVVVADVSNPTVWLAALFGAAFTALGIGLRMRQ